MRAFPNHKAPNTLGIGPDDIYAPAFQAPILACHGAFQVTLIHCLSFLFQATRVVHGDLIVRSCNLHLVSWCVAAIY